jgi:ribose 1,5-bisphosphokinase
MTLKKKNYPGFLILVVGNSGSGKDSIINGVIEKYTEDTRKIHLVQRYITRPPSETEKNLTISPIKFKEMGKRGQFALKWHIYGLDYGVPIEIDKWLEAGDIVLVNVSRTIVKETQKKYKNVKTIFIDVPFEIILKRLRERGREDEKKLAERIERARKNQSFPNADFVIDNSTDLENAINQFLEYLNTIIKDSKI